MTRREIVLAEEDPRAGYPLLTSSVVPRPIAWVSTVSAAGVVNLAPHSFFTVASRRPAMVQFTSNGVKDSLTNVRETGEFVVNFVSEELAEAANATSATFPADVDEFAEVGLTTEPARLVAPPRVAASPIAIECRLHRIVEVGDSFLVIGEVLCVAIEESVLDPDAKRPRPAYQKLNPVARLGGPDEWAAPGDLFRLTRPD
ncbi:flavin reductase (DIM6/NTAB) family NADH-FMN oxidoreductase RutF [Propionibacteriaceae bacterium ES.041]|uniref:flavin reductase family protein n=1 Tax=Enemella evansiae TaxID=2016499 RepID=UPI000B96D453|nr:flavin reductase family protein [Enemella evansiae]OYO03012.1 flavin reductase [Enemella evansiae]PFG69234.1 flavin reductase (DIM6/NTAB) family NADH-FMN oxidoreductase RutF [Propionibacteriaceae bacterium ES.041]